MGTRQFSSEFLHTQTVVDDDNSPRPSYRQYVDQQKWKSMVQPPCSW